MSVTFYLGVVKKIDIQNNKPVVVWIKFDNPKVGEKRRKKYRHLYTSEVQTDWTPIMKVSHNFYVKRGSTLTYFDRTQFPISLACAITTNKGQGDTYDSLECDFRARPVCKHLVYTALSRVKILAKLYIIEEFDAKRISVNEDVSYCVFPCLTILLKLRSVLTNFRSVSPRTPALQL